MLVEQPYRTGEMQVNPYMAFDPLPARVTLTPAVDRWTETKTVWTSPVTNAFKRSTGTGGGSGWARVHHTDTNTTSQTVSSSTSQLHYLRQIDVKFEIAGFGEGETLEAVVFDGIDITESVREA